MSKVLDAILSLSGVPAYGLVGLLAAGEAAAFVGLFLPGEAALLLGGVLASRGGVNLPVLISVAVVAAIVGDSIGYEIGRRGGPALKRSRLGRVVRPERWAKGETFLERRGASAVFFGRWVGLLRALVPSLAGMGRMPYRRFLLWNALGGLLWASTVVLVGYAAGAQYKRVEQVFGRASLLVGLTVLVLGGGFLLARSIAHNPGPWRARLVRAGALPLLRSMRRRFARHLDFLWRRLDPALALGLTLTAGMALAVAAGGVSAVVLEDVLDGDGVAALDQPVLRFLAGRRDDEAVVIARLTALLGSVPFVVLVTLVLVVSLWRRRRRAALVLGASVSGSSMITAALQLLVVHDRPALPLAIDGAERGFSFPSGSGLSSMALYGALSYLAVQYLPTWRSRVYAVAGLLTTAVAASFARLYLGCHWPSDVLGSWALAALWLATVATADRVLAEGRGRLGGDSPAPVPERDLSSDRGRTAG